MRPESHHTLTGALLTGGILYLFLSLLARPLFLPGFTMFLFSFLLLLIRPPGSGRQGGRRGRPYRRRFRRGADFRRARRRRY